MANVVLRRDPNLGNGSKALKVWMFTTFFTGEFDILVATNVAFGALEPNHESHASGGVRVSSLKQSKQYLRKTKKMEV